MGSSQSYGRRVFSGFLKERNTDFLSSCVFIYNLMAETAHMNKYQYIQMIRAVILHTSTPHPGRRP